MREIKFRAWESQTSTLWEPHKIEVKFFNDSHHVNVPRRDGYATYHQFENSPHPLILMQYTGLKDKNGKEVYEGDIVECYAGEHYQGYWEYQNRVVVEYCWTQSMWEMLNCDQLEVIGNIYENPERIPEVTHA